MLILRKAQIDALGDQLKERFVRVMVAHLQEHFPDRSATLGPAAVRDLVIAEITQAESLGILAEQDVAGVIHFGGLVGVDYHTAPGFEWAIAALRDPALPPSERVDRLYAEWAARKPTPGAA